jgi:hypothetical protein
VSQPRSAAGQRNHATVPADADHSAHDGVGADRCVARDLGVTSKLKEALGAASGHADDAMRQHSTAMAAQQYVAANNSFRGHGGDRDRFAVAAGGIHAVALGAEPHGGPIREGLFDHGAEDV